MSLRRVTSPASEWSADAFCTLTAEKSELQPLMTVRAVLLLYLFHPLLGILVNVFFISFVSAQQLVPLKAGTNYLKG